MIKIKCIILPTDFSDCSAIAIRYACELAERFQAELHLLHVVEDVSARLPDFVMGLSIPAFRENFSDRRDRLEADALSRLGKLLPEDLSSGSRLVAATRFGTPFVEIIRYAREHRADLIVMATHGRSGLSHALIGSVAENVIRKSPRPVLSVRPDSHGFMSMPNETQTAVRSGNPKTVIRNAIESLYGPCPVNDFLAADSWARHIDWERVKKHIDVSNRKFDWTDFDNAEEAINNSRHKMLHDAGLRK